MSFVTGAPPWSSDSVLDHRSLPPVFESRCGHIWRLFHLWLRFITVGGHSAHLSCHVDKSGRKTSIIIFWSPLGRMAIHKRNIPWTQIRIAFYVISTSIISPTRSLDLLPIPYVQKKPFRHAATLREKYEFYLPSLMFCYSVGINVGVCESTCTDIWWHIFNTVCN